MNPGPVSQFLQQPGLVQLGLVLVHFVWQAAVIALLAAGAMAILPKRSPNVRYAVALGALGVVVLCPIATWPLVRDQAVGIASMPERIAAAPIVLPEDPAAAPDGSGGEGRIGADSIVEARPAPVGSAAGPASEARDASAPRAVQTGAVEVNVIAADLDHSASWADPAEQAARRFPEDSERIIGSLIESPVAAASEVRISQASAEGVAASRQDSWSRWRVTLLGTAAAGWVAGVALMSLRLLASGIALRSLRRGAGPLDPVLAERAARLSDVLGLHRKALVLTSAAVGEPMAFGLLRPVVLLPAAFLLQCPVAVAETIIAHELAHIRRGDLWINALQRVLEALFFFHPGVLWLSGRIRLERELCCDDAAIAATGARATYASGLLAVAEWRIRPAGALLAAGVLSGRLSMSARIRRILGEPVTSSPRGGWQGVVLVALSLVAFVAAPYLRAEDEPAGDAAESATASGAENEVIDASTTAFPPGSALAELRDFPPEGPLNWPEPCGVEKGESEVPSTSMVQNRVGEEGTNSAKELEKKRAFIAEQKLQLEPATRAGRALHVLRAALLDGDNAEASRRFRPHDGRPASAEELARLRQDLDALGIGLGATTPWTIHDVYPVDGPGVVVVSDRFPGPSRPASDVRLYAVARADDEGVWYVERLQLLGHLDTWEDWSLRIFIRFVAEGRMDPGYRNIDLPTDCFLYFDAFAPLRRLSQESRANIYALTDGVVSEIRAKHGESAPVKKGDVLIKLDSAEIELGLGAAKVRLESARSKAETVEQLADRGQVSATDRFESREALNLAELELRQWELRFDRTQIRSPVDGVVWIENIEPGQLITRGQKVASIQMERQRDRP